MKTIAVCMIIASLMFVVPAGAQWAPPQQRIPGPPPVQPQPQTQPMYDNSYQGPYNAYGQPLYMPSHQPGQQPAPQGTESGAIPAAFQGLSAVGSYFWGYLPAPVRGGESPYEVKPEQWRVFNNRVPGR
jgi:hypothetical protein